MITESTTIAVPEVAFVEGISGSTTRDFPYKGPESFYVELDSDGGIRDIDVPETKENAVKVTWAENPEVCALVGHYFVEDAPVTPEFEEVPLNDGFTIPDGAPTTYQKRTNWDLGDLFDAFYSDGTWTLKQIVKEQGSPLIEEAKRRQRYVAQWTTRYDFSGDTKTAIDAFETAISDYIAAAKVLPVWNYCCDHFNPLMKDIPKVPAVAVAAFSTMPKFTGYEEIF